MTPLDQASINLLVAAFDAMPFDATEMGLEGFVTTTLGLNVSQLALLFPERAAPGSDERHIFVDRLAGALDAQRRKVLQTEARISSGVLVKRTDDLIGTTTYSVLGLGKYLRDNQEKDEFVKRVAQHDAIRAYLTGIGDGFKLE